MERSSQRGIELSAGGTLTAPPKLSNLPYIINSIHFVLTLGGHTQYLNYSLFGQLRVANNFALLLNFTGASCARNRRPVPPSPCRATSNTSVSVNTSPSSIRTTSVLSHHHRRASSIHTVADFGATMTRASLIVPAIVSHQPPPPRFSLGVIALMSTFKNLRFPSLLSKTPQRATAPSMASPYHTPLYLISFIPGRSLDPTQLWPLPYQLLKAIYPLLYNVVCARRPFLVTTT